MLFFNQSQINTIAAELFPIRMKEDIFDYAVFEFKDIMKISGSVIIRGSIYMYNDSENYYNITIVMDKSNILKIFFSDNAGYILLNNKENKVIRRIYERG